MPTPSLYAILLAGGTGTRFWPASRSHRPKQFLNLIGERPMLAETFARLEGLVAPEHTLVVTTEAQLAEVRAAVPEIPAANLLAEPEGRNTAPSIALAALTVRRRDADAIQIVLPADHVIRPREAFQRTVRAAARAAAGDGSLYVFGIHPSHAATAFGWIKAGAVADVVDGIAVHTVERFTEKPDAARARQFLDHGGYFWNSGMFVWSGAAIERALATHAPKALAALSEPLTREQLARSYRSLDVQSFDVAVLERAERVRMLPIDYFWSDVGSWDALSDVHVRDAEENVTSGGTQMIARESRRCIVHGAPGELIALVGVDDLIVVQAGPITLVCQRDRAQEVKLLVERLRAEGSEFQ